MGFARRKFGVFLGFLPDGMVGIGVAGIWKWVDVNEAGIKGKLLVTVASSAWSRYSYYEFGVVAKANGRPRVEARAKLEHA
jgi:hypothetical protein